MSYGRFFKYFQFCSRKCYFGSRVPRRDHFHLFYPSVLLVEHLDLLERREGVHIDQDGRDERQEIIWVAVMGEDAGGCLGCWRKGGDLRGVRFEWLGRRSGVGSRRR